MQIQMATSAEGTKAFVAVQEDGTLNIGAGVVCEWTATTTDADQGYKVHVVDAAVNATTGLAAKVAGVAEQAIATNGKGRLQVFGPANVRASASYAVSRLMVASSINANNVGHVTTAIQTTTTAPEYHGAIVGWSLENGPNATNSTVQLDVL